MCQTGRTKFNFAETKETEKSDRGAADDAADDEDDDDNGIQFGMVNLVSIETLL